MKALEYRKSIPRYALLKALGPRCRRLYTSPLSPLALREIAEPKLPTQQWVRIIPRLTGICGSDLATICATDINLGPPVASQHRRFCENIKRKWRNPIRKIIGATRHPFQSAGGNRPYLPFFVSFVIGVKSSLRNSTSDPSAWIAK